MRPSSSPDSSSSYPVENDSERLVLGDDLPESEADATGAQVSFDTTTRAETCATQPIDFDNVLACGIPQRGIGCDSEDRLDSSTPSTPSLTFSPESIESNSDGDRTIQMSSFIDVYTPPNGYLAPGKQMQKADSATELPPHITISGDFSDWKLGLPDSAHYNGVSLPFTDRDDAINTICVY
jgi:hypothetical protein